MNGRLETWSDDIWVASTPHVMLGLHLGTRMTVVRLPGGALLLHSPIAPDDALRAELDALGDVAHIVAPNLFHHVYAGAMAQAYPHAKFHAAVGLAKKRPDLKIDAELGPAADGAWGGALVPITIDGCSLRETVFVHPRSRSVISSDLTENFASSPHWPTRMYLKAAGIHGKIGWSRFLRVLFSDRAAARKSMDRLLEHDFDRAVIAHGDPIVKGAKDAVRESFRWL